MRNLECLVDYVRNVRLILIEGGNEMTREEVSKRFNALPREHRTTIIGNELEQEIRWLEREKRDAIKAHAKNLERYNERIKTLTRSLDKLQDD